MLRHSVRFGSFSNSQTGLEFAYSYVEPSPQRDKWGSLISKLDNEELILTLSILSNKMQHSTEHNMIITDIRLNLERDMKGLN